jgi:hypothetical protein
MNQLHPCELPEALQDMDYRPNTKPTTIHRDREPLPWRRLLLASALVTIGGFGLGFIAHAIADWLDVPHTEIPQ